MQTDAMQPYQYARPALKSGLQHELRVGANPFRFGMIGSTDSHTGFATAEEDNFWGKMSRSEPSPTRWSQPLLRHEGRPEFEIPEWKMAASGYAAVWARENTRAAIVAAMKRREVYATTGTRIGLRLFAGTEFTPEDAFRPNLARTGYARGVPMGGVLRRTESGVPAFLIHAARDPQGATWIACSSSRAGWRRTAACTSASGTWRCPTGAASWRAGAWSGRSAPRWTWMPRATATPSVLPELLAYWKDPDFIGRRARVLLRAGARDPDAALDGLRPRLLRHGHRSGRPAGAPGAGLLVAGLVHAVRRRASRTRRAS